MMVINEIEHLFCGLCIVSDEKCLFKSSFHFLIKFLVCDVELMLLFLIWIPMNKKDKYLHHLLPNTIKKKNLNKKEKDQDTSQSLVCIN